MISVSVEKTLEVHRAVDIKTAEIEAQTYWLSQARDIIEPSRQEIISSARLYLAMKNLMIARGAQATTSSNCMGEPAKGCLTYCKLNDLGLVGACEGDMDSTLTLLMFQYAFELPGFISDPLIDTAKNAVIHAHCVAPTKMQGPTGARLPFSSRRWTQINTDVGNSRWHLSRFIFGQF